MIPLRCDTLKLFRFSFMCDCIAAGVSLFTSSCVVIIKRFDVVAVTAWTTYRLCADSNDVPLGTQTHRTGLSRREVV